MKNKRESVRPGKNQEGTEDLGYFLAGFDNFRYHSPIPRKTLKAWNRRKIKFT